MSKIKVTKIAYHRNGISGNGFYVVLFKDEQRNMVGILFPEQDCNHYGVLCAVLDINLLANGIIGMFEGAGNAWRGDYYYHHLLDAIEKEKEKIL